MLAARIEHMQYASCGHIMRRCKPFYMEENELLLRISMHLGNNEQLDFAYSVLAI